VGIASFRTFSIAVILLIGADVSAESFVVSKRADTATPAPGGSGNFTAFGLPSPIGFSADFAGGTGVYRFSPTPPTLANSSTAIPSAAGNFTGFSAPTGGGGPYYFRGNGAASQGVYDYRSSGPSLTAVADTSTAIPGGGGNFANFFAPSGRGDGNLAFRANNGGSVTGIYARNGLNTLTLVANNSTAIPGTPGETFVSFGDPLSSGPPTFIGTGATQQGVYRHSFGGSGVLAVWDKNTDVPGAGGLKFTGFSHLSNEENGQLAFVGTWGAGSAGVFTGNGSGIPASLSKFADTSTPIPDGVGNFLSFVATGCSTGDIELGPFVAFQATGSGGQGGIYARRISAGPLLRVVDLNTPLDGKKVASLAMADDAVAPYDSYEVYFKATFTDGSSGVYSAALSIIPEPSAALAVAGMTWLVFLRRR
jgi:hypothetical protein